jgi:hypothetical protein
MKTKLEAVHPVLMASDMAAFIRFYNCLGFELSFQDNLADPKYAAIQRDS